MPITKAVKNDFRKADPNLKQLFLRVRKHVELPEKESNRMTQESSLEQLLPDSPNANAEALPPRLQLLLKLSTPEEQHFLCDMILAMKQGLRDHALIS